MSTGRLERTARNAQGSRDRRPAREFVIHIARARARIHPTSPHSFSCLCRLCLCTQKKCPSGRVVFSDPLRRYGPYCPRPGGPCRSQGCPSGRALSTPLGKLSHATWLGPYCPRPVGPKRTLGSSCNILLYVARALWRSLSVAGGRAEQAETQWASVAHGEANRLLVPI